MGDRPSEVIFGNCRPHSAAYPAVVKRGVARAVPSFDGCDGVFNPDLDVGETSFRFETSLSSCPNVEFGRCFSVICADTCGSEVAATSMSTLSLVSKALTAIETRRQCQR